MDTNILTAEKNISLTIKTKKINAEFSAFSAVRVMSSGDTQNTEKSEGIGFNSSLEEHIEKCSLPYALDRCFYSTPEFLEHIRIYGHPDSSRWSSIRSRVAMKKILGTIRNNQVRFDTLDDETVKKLLYIDSASKSVINVSENTLCNVAMFSCSLLPNGKRYDSYPLVMKKLVEDGRIAESDNPMFWIEKSGTSTRPVAISITDDEFQQLLPLILNDFGEIDRTLLSVRIKELDLFGINELIRE